MSVFHYPSILYTTNTNKDEFSPYIKRVATDRAMPIHVLLGHWERHVNLGNGKNAQQALKLANARARMMKKHFNHHALQQIVLYPEFGYPVHVYDFFSPLLDSIPECDYKNQIRELMRAHEHAPFYSNKTGLWYERDGTVYRDVPPSTATLQSNQNIEAVKAALDARALSVLPVLPIKVADIPSPLYHPILVQESTVSSAIPVSSGFVADEPMQEIIEEQAPSLPEPGRAIFTRIVEPVYDEEDLQELPPILMKPKLPEKKQPALSIPSTAQHSAVIEEDEAVHGDHYQLLDADLYSSLGLNIPKRLMDEDAYYHPKSKRSKQGKPLYGSETIPNPAPRVQPVLHLQRAAPAQPDSSLPQTEPSYRPQFGTTNRPRIPFRAQRGAQRKRVEPDLTQSLSNAINNPQSSLSLASEILLPPEEQDYPESTLGETMNDQEETALEEAMKYLDLSEEVSAEPELVGLVSTLQQQQVPAETAKTIIEQRKSEMIANETTSTTTTTAAISETIPVRRNNQDEYDWEFNPPPPADMEAFLKIFLPDKEAPIHDIHDDQIPYTRTSYPMQSIVEQDILLPGTLSSIRGYIPEHGAITTPSLSTMEVQTMQQPKRARKLPAIRVASPPTPVSIPDTVDTEAETDSSITDYTAVSDSDSDYDVEEEELLLRDKPQPRLDPLGIIPAVTKTRNSRKALMMIVHRLANALHFNDPIFLDALKREAAVSRDPLLTVISPDNDVVLASILAAIGNAPPSTISRIMKQLREMVASERYPLYNPKAVWMHIRHLLPKISQHATGFSSGFGKI